MRNAWTIRSPQRKRVDALIRCGGVRETAHSTGMFDRGKRETLLPDGSIRVESWSLERAS